MSDVKRRPGRPVVIEDSVEVRVTVGRADRDRMMEIGGGNISEGVRIAVRAFGSGHERARKTRKAARDL